MIIPAPAHKTRRLTRAELPVDAVEMARFLVGRVLVHDSPKGRTSGRIVETEAYPVGDAAGHAFSGATRRNRSLFLEPGHAYVYFSYGAWCLFNVSAGAPGIGAGVLVRALEPLDGIDLMKRRRGTSRLRDLARGPGRLAQAMGIGLSCDGVDLCSGNALRLAEDDAGHPVRIGISRRIGISKAVDRPLRFFARDNPFVSGPRGFGPPRTEVSARSPTNV